MIGRGVYYILYIYIFIYCYISARTFFYLSKYSLSDAHFSTGRLLFEFNRLQYTLAAPEVFASSANPVILPSGYRVSIVRNTNIDQIETTPLRYCIRLNTPTPGTASYVYTASPVILWFDPGLIAREGFSNVSYSKKCALQHTKSLKKFSEGKA